MTFLEVGLEPLAELLVRRHALLGGRRRLLGRLVLPPLFFWPTLL